MAALAVSRPVPSAPPAIAGLALLGDAIAVFDCVKGGLAWVSDAWLAMLPCLAAGTSVEAIEQALPGGTGRSESTTPSARPVSSVKSSCCRFTSSRWVTAIRS